MRFVFMLSRFSTCSSVSLLCLRYSVVDDARERPVIEVVTKDVRAADIFYILEGTRAPVVDEEWRYLQLGC